MSLKAIAEFAIHVDTFKNIGLLYQGLYHIRFRIYNQQDDQDQRIYAQPYVFKEGLTNNLSKNKPNSIFNPQIIDEQSIYCTKTFGIRFSNEEIELNELCQFRVEYEAYPYYQQQEFFLEAELMFCDTSFILKQNIDDDNHTKDSGFKSVSTFRAKIIRLHEGIHEYMSIIFDKQYFSITSINFHSLLIDFKFRYNPNDTLVNPQEVEKDKQFKENKIKKFEYTTPFGRTFTEFLSITTSNCTSTQLDAFHGLFVQGLQKSYEKLVKYYDFVLKLLANENEINNLKDAPLLEIDSKNQLANQKKPETSDKMMISSSIEEVKSETSTFGLRTNDSIMPKNKFIKFSQSVNSTDPESIAKAILMEFNITAGKSFELWYLLLEQILANPRTFTRYHKIEYHKHAKKRYDEIIFRHIYIINDFVLSYEPKIGKYPKQIVSDQRENFFNQNFQLCKNIEDMDMFPHNLQHPLLFEEICMKNTPDKINDAKALEKIDAPMGNLIYEGIHLIVLVHGFQGTSYDMKQIKNNLMHLYPNAVFLISASNEDNTECEIEIMGKRLANEVKGFIYENFPEKKLGRLSFIGHSLGGLIIRASLEYLKEFKEKMHSYISFSSPHLGYMYNSSKIIDAGMWILKKWRKSVTLSELSMTDTDDLEDAYLYKLSQKPGLDWFKYIALVSSSQDQYAPFDSARIQIGHKIQNDHKGKVFVKMAKNILSNVGAECIYRINIDFKISEKNLDTMIGRAAHIQFIENSVFLRMFGYRYDKFFS